MFRNNIIMEIYQEKYNKYKQKYIEFKKLMNHKSKILINDVLDKNKLFVNLSGGTIEIFNTNKYPSTYGELTREGMKHLIENLEIETKGKKLIDLGSGLGKVPLFAVVDHQFAFGKGVELAKERYDKSIEMLKKIPELHDKIEYENGDLMKTNIKGFDVIFVSNLCFSADLNKKLTEKLKEADIGTIIATSKELYAPYLQTIKVINVKMTWSSTSTLYIHKKI